MNDFLLFAGMIFWSVSIILALGFACLSFGVILLLGVCNRLGKHYDLDGDGR